MRNVIINHHGNVEEVSAPAFTPGPWEAVSDIGVVNAGERQIAAVLINGNVRQREANARLIAAAPELYEALEVARGEIARVHQLRSALPQIDAALAKARGE